MSAKRGLIAARGSRRRSLLLCVVAALVLGGTTVFAVAAGAVNTLGSGFSIDGTVPDVTSPPIAFFPDSSGSVAELDVINQATAKLGNIRYDAPPTLDYNDENPGNDLSGVWMDTNVVGGQVWLYFAFARDAASTGQVVFEFDKSGAPTACNYAGVNLTNPPGANNTATQDLIANCNPWANRSPGDFSLAFDVQGGAAKIVKRVYFDTGSGNNQQGWTSTTLDASVSAAAFGPNALTGEGVVNLSATVFPANPTSCFSVANILPYTVTGNSDSADMKDVVLGDFTKSIAISNCGSVRVKKATDPAGSTGSFPYTLSRADNSSLRYAADGGQTSLSGTLTSDGDSDLIDNIKIGTNYTLAEGSLNSAWALQTISCTADGTTKNVYPGVGGPPAVPQSFEVAPSTVTECTITNKKRTGTLTLVKTVINDNGGTKVVADFPLAMSGTAVTSGQTVTFNEGTQVTASETNQPGYAAGLWGGDCAADGTVTIAVDQNKTCTITNDDVAGTLIVKKTVINDNGGTKKATDFSFKLDGGGAVAFVQDGQNALAGKNTLSVSAGVHSVVEDALPIAGYTTTYNSCANVTVANGATQTCEIVNDDQAGTLIVKKLVINDDGGTKKATDFAFTLDGGASVAFLQDGDTLHGKNTLSVSAGAHSVVEADLPIAGYTTSYDAGCSGAVANGETKTCTITNDDQAGTLVVKKLVVNDNGGTKKASDFSFQVNGGSATGFVLDGDDLHGKNTLTVDAGQYSVVEDALPIAGYTTTYEGCSGVVGNGETKTCTITNDDQAGTIIVKKTVVNDEGGTKTAGDFSFKVGDAAPVAFVQDGQDPLKGEKSVSVSAGTYTVTEPAVAGYDVSYEDCASIVVGNGETKTCTITNNDSIPPTVDVQKTVRVAGTEDAFAETASAPESSGTFEYRVVVWNKSTEAVSLTTLTDTVGAVVTNLNGKGSCSVPQTLTGSDGNSGGADTYVCTFELTFTGNAGDSQTDTVKATVKDDENDTATDEDNASVSLTDRKSSIEVTKTADPTTIDESLNGSDVTYTVVVKNTSTVDKVSLDTSSFVDRVKVNGDPATGVITEITNLDCDLESNQSDGLPASLDPGESITCTFTMPVEGKAGDDANDLITVTGQDDDGQSVSDSDDATVKITDIPSSITVTKTANPTVVQDSGPVTFTVVVRNDSAVDTVYITSLTDSIYGDLNGKGSCTLVDDVSAGPEGVSREILPGASYTCSFTATMSKTETDVVTASGVDDDGQPVKDDDDATVTVNHTPPPEYVPRTDIAVTKAATPKVQLPQGGGTAPITYNLVVVNNGPDAAANVKVADTAPASVTFVSATTSGGSCTTAAQTLDCTIASLAPGASIAITIKATVNATGTKSNVVVVTTTTPETNTANNEATAQTLVTAPVTPPTSKPTPAPELCKALLVTPKMLKATGKSQKTNISVTRGKNGVAGVRVKLTGPGISTTARTGKNGKVKLAIKPGRPGIIKVAIPGTKVCNSQRIGVVGVFEPPVTG